MRYLALVLLLGCGKSSGNKATVDGPTPAQRIDMIKGWADRCDACDAGRDCVKPIRDEWEQWKYNMRDAAETFSPADRQAYDTVLGRFRMCGDGAGVTIWLN